MGALGKIISDAVGAAKDAVLEKEPKLCTTVEDFLTKFSDSSGKYANQINTLTTFEVSFKFYPTLDQVVKNDKDDKEKKSKLGKALDAAVGSVKSSFTKAAKNAVNNLTGGLLASLNNEKNNDVAAVMDQHGSFKDKGTYSFMHYLAAANLLVGDENEWFGKAGQSPKPLEMQLGYYVQDIVIPQLKIPDGQKSTTLLGEFNANGRYVIPDNNTLQMTILNTKLPLIERIFYPWMKEVTYPFWSYDSQPYTTATITIDFNKHTDMKYVFCGCRPQMIQMMQANQENDASTKRQVTFLFDYMYVSSNLTTMPKAVDKVTDLGSKLFNSAANMLKL